MERDELRDSLRAELDSTRQDFYSLVNSLSDQDLERRSLNPGWTNRELLFHILLAFILLESLGPMARFWGRLPRSAFKPFAWLLDAFTGLFNWVNALGPRGAGRVFTRARLLKRYDRVHQIALKMIDSMSDEEWARGMYYPARWDPLFSGYMTIEQVFRYPAIHFHFHAQQIAR